MQQLYYNDCLGRIPGHTTREPQVLVLVSTDVVLKSGRHISDSEAAAAEMSLVRWQPDFITISYTSKKIAIGAEVC